VNRFARLLAHGVANGSADEVELPGVTAEHFGKAWFERFGYEVTIRSTGVDSTGRWHGEVLVVEIAHLDGIQRAKLPGVREWCVVDNDDVGMYLAIVWTLGAPIRKPRSGLEFSSVAPFVGALSLRDGTIVSHLDRHSRSVRAAEIVTTRRRYLLVAFYGLDPRAIEGLEIPLLTARYGNVTVLEIDL